MKINLYASEYKKNLQIATPIMLGQLGHILVGFADNIMVGKIGAVSLASVSLTNSLVFIAFSLGIGFTFSITPLIAKSDGEKNYKKGKEYFTHGILLSFILGILLCGLLFLIKPFLPYMNQPKDVLSHLFPYYEIITYSMLPMLIFQAYKQFSDGLSFTKYAMRATIYANILNVILNYLLIYGNFGFPKLGLTGAGIGTLISRIVMLGIMIWMVHTKPRFQPFISKIRFSLLQKKIVNKMINLGYPTALQMLFEIGIFATGILLAGMIGTKSQAANQISLNLATMTFMISIGLAVTATIRVSNQLGQKNHTRLLYISSSIFTLMILMDIVFALFFILLKDFLPIVYISDSSVIEITSTLLIITGLFQIPDGIQIVLLGALRGLQDVKIPMVITFISYWLIGFPICYYLSLHTELKTIGIWIGLFVGLTAAAVLLYFRFKKLTNILLLT